MSYRHNPCYSNAASSRRSVDLQIGVNRHLSGDLGFASWNTINEWLRRLNAVRHVG